MAANAGAREVLLGVGPRPLTDSPGGGPLVKIAGKRSFATAHEGG